MLAKKTHSRRRAIVTPIKKAPASLKASREEAARIKASQGAKAARLSPKKDRGNEEGSDDEGGLTEREKSRRRAAQWAQAARLFPKEDLENEEDNDNNGRMTEREKSRRRAAEWAQAANLFPKEDLENEEDNDNKGGMTEKEKSRRRAAEWAKDQKGKKAQDKKGEATAAAAATPGKRPRGENE